MNSKKVGFSNEESLPIIDWLDHHLDLCWDRQHQAMSARLEAWGPACGLDDPASYDRRLETWKNKVNIERTLQVIGEKLSKRSLQEEWGLKCSDEEHYKPQLNAPILTFGFESISDALFNVVVG